MSEVDSGAPSHPSENTLASMFGGGLSSDERVALDGHLDRCAECRRVVADLARAASQATDPSGDARDASRAVPASFAPGERYELRRLIGRGGMGEVYLALDRPLNRPVALKRIRPELASDAATQRFLREAQIAAQLEHPNILPIHDIGTERADPYFTMKLVQGKTLQQVLTALAAGDPETSARYPMTRLGILCLQLTQAIAYAHARGVLHCDLKPSNVLIGEHGEVLISDWGLAQVGWVEPEGMPPVLLTVSPPPERHRGGTVLFMSPEQASGGALDRRSDIYALGALLYCALTLHPPHEGRTAAETVERILHGDLVPPRERAPHRDVSEDLERICLRALSRNPERRFQTADEMADALEAFLTGARRRQKAHRKFLEAEEARKKWLELCHQEASLEERRRELAKRTKSYDGETKKAPLWELEERLDETGLAKEQVLAVALDGYSQAIGIDPGFSPAAEQLADLHLRLFLDAEASGDKRAEFFHRRQLERHHRGRHASLLAGEGVLSLRCAEPGAALRGYRLVERGKRILPEEEIDLQGNALEERTLPMGSYLFSCAAPGKREAHVPVAIGRGTRLELSVRLFEEAKVGPDFVHVPAGPFLYGGDKTALNAAPRQELWLDDFLIARFPVTCEEYLAFLNDLTARDPNLAQRHVPRTKPDGGFLWERDATGRYFLPKFDGDGNPCYPRAPVMGVSFDDAEMYSNWISARTGLPHRLPREEEWEKAARGADGRFFPWGNGFDPSFCKMALSRPGRPQPEPVGSFPVDTSVYGMQDAAGAIREWCDSFYDEAHQTRVLRGGAWYFNPHYCRLAFRHGYLPHIVFTNFGFRLCRDG